MPHLFLATNQSSWFPFSPSANSTDTHTFYNGVESMSINTFPRSCNPCSWFVIFDTTFLRFLCWLTSRSLFSFLFPFHYSGNVDISKMSTSHIICEVEKILANTALNPAKGTLTAKALKSLHQIFIFCPCALLSFMDESSFCVHQHTILSHRRNIG